MEQLVSSRRARLHSESEASTSSGAGEMGGRSGVGQIGGRGELRTPQHSSPAPSTLASPIKSPIYADSAEEVDYTNKSK